MLMTERSPSVQLAPDSPSTHTSWRAYSSPPWGPGCSQVHRWGAPWWPAHPHLEASVGQGGKMRNMQADRGRKSSLGGQHLLNWPCTGRLKRHKTHKGGRYAGELSMNPIKRSLSTMLFLFLFPLNSLSSFPEWVRGARSIYTIYYTL